MFVSQGIVVEFCLLVTNVSSSYFFFLNLFILPQVFNCILSCRPRAKPGSRLLVWIIRLMCASVPLPHYCGYGLKKKKSANHAVFKSKRLKHFALSLNTFVTSETNLV